MIYRYYRIRVFRRLFFCIKWCNASWYFDIPGHGCSLQYSIFMSSPSHSLPPYRACLIIFLLDVFSPPPQDFEHSDHSSKSDHWQFSKKWKYENGHNFLIRTLKTNLNHEHLSFIIKLSNIPGQGLSLHFSIFILSPSQSFPPPIASLLIVLFDTFSPPPQVLEHSDHFPNSDQTQSTVTAFTWF